MIWLILNTASGIACVVLCMRAFHSFLNHPTTTSVFKSEKQIIYPDITVCNEEGFDKLLIFQLMDLFNNSNQRNVSKLNPEEFVVPEFQLPYLKFVSKITKFMTDLGRYEQFNKIRSEVFAKSNIGGFLKQTDIEAGGIAMWKLFLDCKYGKNFLFVN